MIIAALYPHLLESTSQEGVPKSPGKSQKEGQEDQGEVKELGVPFLSVLRSPVSPGLPSASSLGSLELPPGRYSQGDEDKALSGFKDFIRPYLLFQGCLFEISSTRAAKGATLDINL